MPPVYNNPHSSGANWPAYPAERPVGDDAPSQAPAQNRWGVSQPGRPSVLRDGRAGNPRAGRYRPYSGSPLQRLLEQPPTPRGANAMVPPSPGSSLLNEQERLAGFNLLLATATLGAERQSPREIARSHLLGVQHELIETLYRNERLLRSQLGECNRRLQHVQGAFAELTAVSAEQASSLRGYSNWNRSLCLSMQAMENELTELRAQARSVPRTQPPAPRARLSSDVEDLRPVLSSTVESSRPRLSSRFENPRPTPSSPVEYSRPMSGTWVPSQLSPDSTVRLPTHARPRDEGGY